MFKKIFTPKVLIISSFFILVFFLISLFYRPVSPLPLIISSDPANNAQSVISPDTIKLKFDQNLDISLLRVESSPPEDWSIQSGLDPTLVILKSKQYFHADTLYSISLFYNEKQLPPLTFKTIHQQGDPRYTRQVLTDMERDYPLAQKLPLKTPQYRVVYSAPMTLEITILNPNLTSSEVVDDIKTWVIQNGGNAATHKYVVATPKPTSTN